MSDAWMTGQIARWEVIWFNRKAKRFTVKVFGNDLAAAEALYAKVLAAQKPFATLRCCNVGFPPPMKYRPYMKKFVRREKVKRQGRTRTKKVIVELEQTPMEEINLKGVWWCPYCRKMRKFRKLDGMMYRDGTGDYYLDGTVYACPVCEITHTNHHVRKWNPHASRLSYRTIRQTRVRRSNSGARKRRTRRRK